jgi:hypothetical protein
MALNARLNGVGTILVLGLLVLSLTALDSPTWFKVDAAASFTFAAAGDFGQNANTNASLNRLASSGASFFLALGDLSYTIASPETHWCNIIKSHVGQNYPFELLSGNHEDGGEIRPPDGFIGNFTKCLPNQIETMNGDYGKEFYFDYPTINPLARFIMISPGLNFSQPNGQFDFYSYDNGTSHYQWTASAIDGARASGIPWIIVGMHKVCLSAGAYECTIGPNSTVRPDIIQLLLKKHVDLVLQGHDHNYQRSKQLDCLLPENFQSSCVANSGSDGFYSPGAGTVFIIDGTFGASNEGYDVHLSETDAQYFAKFIAPNIGGAEYGFVMYTVSANRIRGQTNFDGSSNDSFQIGTDGIFRTIQLFLANGYMLTAVITAAVLLVALATILLVRRRNGRP